MIWKRSMVRLNLILSLTFGVVMGIIFPLYAAFFVEFKSQSARNVFIAGCLAAGILVGLGAFFITRLTLLKVVYQITRELSRLDSKDADLTRRFPEISQDALGRLPLKLNLFLDSICGLVNLTQVNMSRTEDMSQQLIGNMNHTLEAVTKISGIIAQLNSSTDAQAEHVSRNGEAWENMNQVVLNAVSHVLELFDQMNHLTKQMLSQSDSIEGIQKNISLVSDLIENPENSRSLSLSSLIYSFMDLTEKTLEQDLESFLELDEFIGKIEDISSRTSTLAINASIEAARSGKQGEGFKVIAQEVRKLSSEAELLSSQIRGNIETNQMQIKNSHQEILQSRNSVKQYLENAKNALSGLQDEASMIRKNTDTVQKSYEQVSGLLQMIRDSLDAFQNSSTDSKRIMKDLGHSTEEILEGMSSISDMSEEIRKMATRTGSQVELMGVALDEVNQQLLTIKTEKTE